ncbi:MAG: O-sialoglycoprotein endopeptidase [Desulfitobacteriaceae bacterium]|nr:O-sialoglycoprotein endopeptidase [Desulfitobacteriaceae bacterium]MDD4752344.1 O-sialoglycoprotein endopeptidase [Desulfitobacteriaceae bacterium]
MILGIDTSCYTTSLAVVDLNGQVIEEARILLKVKPGERGLQQSVAVFQHVQNVPALIEGLSRHVDFSLIEGVCASTRPRPVKGSYMPVFTVSQGVGKVIAHSKRVPFFETSHQEGHIMAGIWSAQGPNKNIFLAVHLSGGTSEVLKVEKKETGFHIEILGATGDLHAGQFIDRIGVEMGLPFPSGPHLEKIAQGCSEDIPFIPTGAKGYQFSFSGPETAARRLLSQGFSQEQVARAVEHCIATTLEKVLRKAVLDHGLQDVLIVGGVASNEYIKQRLRKRLEHRAVGAKLFFAEPRYSTDNAIGTALLGLAMYQKI